MQAQKWKAKAFAFRALSSAPGGMLAHFLLQRYVSRSIPRPPKDLDKVREQAARVTDAYKRHATIEGSRWLEFGAGRDLSNAISIRESGAEYVLTIDLTRLAKLPFAAASANYLAGWQVHGWRDLEAHGVKYVAPSDARSTGFPGSTFSAITSWNTLEHIPKDDISAIHRESFRILKPGGLSIQKIDYEDHFWGFDRSISLYNYLTIPESEWRKYQSSLLYQNRLRHSQHVALMRQAGFEIVEDTPTHDPIEPDVLAKLAPEFQGMDPTDLFTAGAIVVGRKPPN